VKTRAARANAARARLAAGALRACEVGGPRVALEIELPLAPGSGPRKSPGPSRPLLGGAQALPGFVVAIGASLEDLDALRVLLRHSPFAGDCAMVVILQLGIGCDRSTAAELLGKDCALQIETIEDGVSPVPGTLYVNGLQKLVTLHAGHFTSADRPPAFAALPLGVLLGSLGLGQGDQCAAILLGGAATDGGYGAHMLREAGGLVLVQEPVGAPEELPQRVLSSGCVDLVGTPAQLCERLESYVRSLTSTNDGASGSEHEAVDQIVKLLSERSRIHFAKYERDTLTRRIRRRAGWFGAATLPCYLDKLQSRPDELDQLTREALGGATQFFRDPAAWRYLEQKVLPDLLAGVEEGGVLRVWVAGCATGEEGYSLGMLLEQQIQRSGRLISYRLFATEVRRDLLRQARAGEYPLSACHGIPEALRERYFDLDGDTLVAKRLLRDKLIFTPHDLLVDPPFTQLDLVSCRNLLGQVEPEARAAVLSRFRAALNEGGFLMLGAAESAAQCESQFRLLDDEARIYLARGPSRSNSTLAPRARAPSRELGTGQPLLPRSERSSEFLYEAALQRYVPAGVAVNDEFELLQLFGKVAQFVRMPPGRATINLLDMVPRPLGLLLGSAGRKALRTREEISIPDLSVVTPSGELTVCLRIVPVDDPSGVALGLLIFFELPGSFCASARAASAEFGDATQQRLRELIEALALARETLSSAVQDLEAQNQEWRAKNQELTASNAELTSSNEELQSVNEELYTVNTESQNKIGALDQLNGNLEDLLSAVNVGGLLLDRELAVVRFNPTAMRLFALREADLGRPLREIAMNGEYPSLDADLRETLRSGVGKSINVRAHDGAFWQVGLQLARAGHGGSAGGVLVTTRELSEPCGAGAGVTP
jgi:two-component system, chemotaxis family, CheB/CheR fusion protein